MLRPYIIENLNKVKRLKPSLLLRKIDFQNGDGCQIQAVLYLPLNLKSDDLDDKFEIIGSLFLNQRERENLNLSENESKFFYVSGISAAYPGFGAFLYQSAMMFINEQFDNKGLLIADRKSITWEAERLYVAMNKSPEFDSINIPLDHPLFSSEMEDSVWDALVDVVVGDEAYIEYEEYLEGLKSGIYEHTYLNKGYHYTPNREMEVMYKKVTKQNSKNKLSELDVRHLVENTSDLSEYVYEEKKSLLQDLENGFPNFSINEQENTNELVV